jgi:hypothetical protein
VPVLEQVRDVIVGLPHAALRSTTPCRVRDVQTLLYFMERFRVARSL